MRPETRDFFNLCLKKAYPYSSRERVLQCVKTELAQIELPAFDNNDIAAFRSCLEQTNKTYDLSKKPFKEKLLDVMEMVYFLYSTTNKDALLKYIEFLVKIDFLLRKMLEPKNNEHEIQVALGVLRPELEKFIGKFAKIAEGDND